MIVFLPFVFLLTFFPAFLSSSFLFSSSFISLSITYLLALSTVPITPGSIVMV
jgi:hypothetical protein